MITYEYNITCENDDAKLPWESPEEARNYILDIISTHASDTDKLFVTNTVIPILTDPEKATLSLVDIIDDAGLTGSNKLKVSMKFSSQEEYDTFIQAGSNDTQSTLKTMLDGLYIFQENETVTTT
jgi:hypothetical protein